MIELLNRAGRETVESTVSPVTTPASAELNNMQLTKLWSYRFTKRIMDVFVAVFALILLSPLMCLISVAIKLDSNGPIFYTWHVVGHGGRRFTGYKFRTMFIEADEIKPHLW